MNTPTPLPTDRLGLSNKENIKEDKPSNDWWLDAVLVVILILTIVKGCV